MFPRSCTEMFANIQAKRKLEEALSAQDDVTPGTFQRGLFPVLCLCSSPYATVWCLINSGVAAVYLLEDIWSSMDSGGADVKGVVEAVQKKLSHKSPTVKLKVCITVQAIAQLSPTQPLPAAPGAATGRHMSGISACAGAEAHQVSLCQGPLRVQACHGKEPC